MFVATGSALLVGLVLLPACSSQGGAGAGEKNDRCTNGSGAPVQCTSELQPGVDGGATPANGAKDNGETFDAGRTLPEDRPDLNPRNYSYPELPGTPAHDSADQIAAPGRANQLSGVQVDVVRINPGDEPWMDLHGNLNEAVLDMQGATFTGKFGLKYRGIGYSSARSPLNVTPDASGVQRLERPEARAGFAGGRCMRFK